MTSNDKPTLDYSNKPPPPQDVPEWQTGLIVGAALTGMVIAALLFAGRWFGGVNPG